ncbi:MAG: LytR/AlgR family response regulator transcription factor [Saprospiraceae bacterium]
MEIKNIFRCEAQSNYTQFYFKDGTKILVSKTLKGYENILSDLHFFRINRSQLVNLKCIKIVGRQRNPAVSLDNETELVMSSFRKCEFFKKMGKVI